MNISNVKYTFACPLYMQSEVTHAAYVSKLAAADEASAHPCATPWAPLAPFPWPRPSNWMVLHVPPKRHAVKHELLIPPCLLAHHGVLFKIAVCTSQTIAMFSMPSRCNTKSIIGYASSSSYLNPLILRSSRRRPQPLDVAWNIFYFSLQHFEAKIAHRLAGQLREDTRQLRELIMQLRDVTRELREVTRQL